VYRHIAQWQKCTGRGSAEVGRVKEREERWQWQCAFKVRVDIIFVDMVDIFQQLIDQMGYEVRGT